jgi:hypothetical protein
MSFCKMDDGEMVPIPGFERYVISKTGIIADLLTGLIRKQSVHVNKTDGYKQLNVKLWKDDGKRYYCIIARLLAKTFIPNPDGLPTVDHVDRNSLNNSLQNLRWADHSTQARNKKAHSNTGHKHIYLKKNATYEVIIKEPYYDKCFKTLEEAIIARDSILAYSVQGQSS